MFKLIWFDGVYSHHKVIVFQESPFGRFSERRMEDPLRTYQTCLDSNRQSTKDTEKKQLLKQLLKMQVSSCICPKKHSPSPTFSQRWIGMSQIQPNEPLGWWDHPRGEIVRFPPGWNPVKPSKPTSASFPKTLKVRRVETKEGCKRRKDGANFGGFGWWVSNSKGWASMTVGAWLFFHSFDAWIV